MSHLSAIVAIELEQVQGSLAREKYFDRLDPTTDELSLFDFGVLVPRHEPVMWELLQLPAKEVAAVLTNVILVSLEEIVNEVVQLWVVRQSTRVRISSLLRIALRNEKVLLVDLLETPKVRLLVKETFTLELLSFILFLSEFIDTILPVLRVSAEDALEKVCAILV